jgi:hypothetical protein
MSDSAPEDIISWEDLIYLADFMEVSGERRCSLLGGEPTLHPQFNSMVLYLLERHFDVNVFTSGIMSERTLAEAERCFKDVPRERLSFVCNVNDPEQTPASPGEIDAVRRFLKVFGPRVVPGFNIYRLDFELDFLFQYINEFGLKREIRLGLAHPIPNQDNLHIPLADLDQVIDRLFSHAAAFERLRLKPGLDCGFPLCRFDDSQLAWFYRQTGGKQQFGCGPVVDIGPDMMVWSCFPLSAFHSRSIFEFNSLGEVYEYYRNLHSIIRIETGGIFTACDACLSREDQLCAGGCLAHLLAQFQNEAPVRMPEIYS